MKRKLLVSGLAALLTPGVYGADVNRSWEALLESLKTGRKVVVVQHSRKQAEGKVLALAGDSITVQVGRQPVTVQRDDVFRVRIADIRRRNTLIGMAIGAATGAIIWGVAGRDNHRVGEYALIGSIFGVGPGAAVGGSVPIGVPLYEAPGGLSKRAR